jgi:hypothetical protein
MRANARVWRLAATYGITPELFTRMVDDQGGACAICGETKVNTLCVDHDHKSGVVRGLLCKACNFGLGYFHDSCDKLAAAAAYLTRSRS